MLIVAYYDSGPNVDYGPARDNHPGAFEVDDKLYQKYVKAQKELAAAQELLRDAENATLRR